MLNAIYASKLYRASPRKDKIRAAFDNPINTELVGQLAKALDEEYQTSDYLVKEHEPVEPKAESSEGNVSTGSQEEPSGGGMPAGGAPHRSSSPAPKGSEPPEESSEGQESSVEPPEASGEAGPAPSDAGAADAGPSPVGESTRVDGSKIVASQIRTEFSDMRQVADQVKGLLNFKESTAGVNRILTKENEFWVYYNDGINLNNVMGDAIELLNASNYTFLEFNRLARSDNAMVFQIDFNTSERAIKAMLAKDDKK